ncbi:MAG: class I tRNA ligase family protein, partial [Planctomycetes bacterium]|nr:class I tRNA ligase family protein [Planctomycetota bacterium]
WGHQIPIWYGPDGSAFSGHDEADARGEAERKLGRGVRLERDPDVLDTWFSSALWPFSTLGWPDDTPELRYYYPTSTLVTDRGIIFFWVARMVMMGEEMMGREPFRHVYIHGTILDREGRKMSKTLKNGIDPVALIDGGADENTGNAYEPHGADGVRYSLATLTTEGQDLKLWPEQFKEGQSFLTKLWNAGRFTLGHLAAGEASVAPRVALEDLRLEDRWVLARLGAAVREATERLEGFRYCDAAQRVRSFARDEFCDWYVEAAKFRLGEGADPEDARRLRRVLAHVLDVLLRLLHPVCPFITEEIWRLLGERVKDRRLDGLGVRLAATPESVMVASWPEAPAADPALEAAAETFGAIQEIVRRVRKIRQERNVPPAQTLEAILSFASAAGAERVRADARLVRDLGRVERLTVGTSAERPPSCAVETLPGLEVIVPLPAADVAREREALEKRRRDLAAYIQREEAKLSNPSFAGRAPRDVVEAARKRVEDARAQREAVAAQILRLGG